MIDEALGEQELPAAPSGDWRAELRALAGEMWEFIQQHPWYPEAVSERPPITPHGVAAFEFALRIACRSEPGPEFCVVVTEKPVALADPIASNMARTVSAVVAASKAASFLACAWLIGGP